MATSPSVFDDCFFVTFAKRCPTLYLGILTIAALAGASEPVLHVFEFLRIGEYARLFSELLKPHSDVRKKQTLLQRVVAPPGEAATPQAFRRWHVSDTEQA
jgi:hypothetical protein